MSKLGVIFAFSLGAGAGAFVTWKVLKKKYDQQLQEDVEVFREVYTNRPIPENREENLYSEDSAEDTADEPKHSTKSEDDAFQMLLKKYDRKSEAKEEDEYGEKPYVIPPEEFDTLDDYDVVSYTYYADGVLVDDDHKVVTDMMIDKCIGRDSLKSFGMYEDDSVFVRNDRLKIDYEILADVRKFSDVIKQER